MLKSLKCCFPDEIYILGLERKDYVGSAVMYFNNLDLLNKIQNEVYDLIKKTILN